jgi:membrane protease YdiL (CAAX protease family)
LTARDFFWDSTGNVRPPWRLAIFAVSCVVALVVINMAVLPLVGSVFAALGVRVVLYPWALLASGLLAHALTFRMVEPRRWAAVRLDAAALAPRSVGLGITLGALAVGIPSLLLLAIGWLRVVPAGDGSSILAGVSTALFLAPAALWEELTFRGYAFTVLSEWLHPAVALGLTSLVFGLVHLQNAGASVPSILVVILAGVFLGGVLLVTRSLYAAFAAHLAWNWTLAGALHSAVSGIPFVTPDYHVVDAGPDWATGGIWGPEGGVPAALGLTVATIYLYLRRARREES